MIFNPSKRERKRPNIGQPSDDKGRDGDIELFLTKQGLAMFGKFNGQWYPFSVAKERGLLKKEIFNIINVNKELSLKNQGVLKFFGNSNKYSSSFKQSGSARRNIDYILPNAPPDGNKALVSDSSNNLSWNQYISRLTVTANQGLILSEFDDDNKQNISGIDASTVAKGVVELATGAETSSGTDTTRAVTPGGLAANILTHTWAHTVSGMVTTNTSTANYYFSEFGNMSSGDSEEWASTVADPTSIDYRTSYSGSFWAPYAGRVTQLMVSGWASAFGFSDPVKFYIYKVTPEDEVTSLTGALLHSTSAITAGYSTRTFFIREVVNASFSNYDMLYLFVKKDATTAAQTLKFNISISGVYTY